MTAKGRILRTGIILLLLGFFAGMALLLVPFLAPAVHYGTLTALQEDLPGTFAPSGILPAALPEESGDFCILTELLPAATANRSIVRLTDADGAEFPAYRDAMMRGNRFAGEWYDGRRNAGSFVDPLQQYDGFLALACRESPDPACTAGTAPAAVYAYNGRFFEFACLPGNAERAPPKP